MIYIKFTVDSRLKKIISSNKKYSLQEASSILEKLEEHTKNNKSIESVEYSILENYLEIGILLKMEIKPI